MPILPSAGPRIHELLDRLSRPTAAERESAVAQLTLVGPRLLSHLPSFLARASRSGRLGAVEVLERLGDAKGLAAILALVRDEHEDVARRAIEASAGFPDARTAEALAAILASPSPALRHAAARSLCRLHEKGLVEATGPLLDVLFDRDEDESTRLAVLEALSTLERRTLLPALRRLAGDRSSALVRGAEVLAKRLGPATASGPKAGALPPDRTAPLAGASTDVLIARLTSTRTPPTAVAPLVAALVARSSPALVPVLRRRLDELGRDAAGTGQEAVARARARVHLVLGALDSRIALHDLRDLLRTRPLYAAEDVLAVAEQVGDASLIAALAALAADEPGLVGPAGKAFRAIARREKLSRASRAIKTLRAEHRAAAERLWPRPGAAQATRARKGRSG